MDFENLLRNFQQLLNMTLAENQKTKVKLKSTKMNQLKFSRKTKMKCYLQCEPLNVITVV